MAQLAAQLHAHGRCQVAPGWQLADRDYTLRCGVLSELQHIYSKLRPGHTATAAPGSVESFLCSVEAELYTHSTSRAAYADASSLQTRLLSYLAPAAPRYHQHQQQQQQQAKPQVAMQSQHKPGTLGTAPPSGPPVPPASPPAQPAMPLVPSTELEGSPQQQRSSHGELRLPKLALVPTQPSASSDGRAAPAAAEGQPLPKRSRQSMSPPLMQLGPPLATVAGLAPFQHPPEKLGPQLPAALLPAERQLLRAGSAPPATTLPPLDVHMQSMSQQAGLGFAPLAATQAAMQQHQHLQQASLLPAAFAQQQPPAIAAAALAAAQQQQQKQQTAALTRAPSAPVAVLQASLPPSLPLQPPAAAASQQQQLFCHLAPQAVPPGAQQQLVITYQPALLAAAPSPHQQHQQQQQYVHIQQLPQQAPLAAAQQVQLAAGLGVSQQVVSLVPPPLAGQPLALASLSQQLLAQQAAILAQARAAQAVAAAPAALAAGAAVADEDNESTGSHTSPAGPERSSEQLVSAVAELCLCPLTRRTVEDPVLAADGHTYERSALVAWLEHNTTSPATGAPLPSLDIKPNRAVKALADLLRTQKAVDGSAGARAKCQPAHQS